MTRAQHYKCIIVGSGFFGICLAIKRKMLAMDDCLVLEKASEPGGTWRDNHDPGAECDVRSALHSFSFETKTGSVGEYRRATRRFNPADYQLT